MVTRAMAMRLITKTKISKPVRVDEGRDADAVVEEVAGAVAEPVSM